MASRDVRAKQVAGRWRRAAALVSTGYAHPLERDRLATAIERLFARGHPAPRLACAAMKVTLPDGTELELPDGATGADAAAAIGPGLAARGARREGRTARLRDLARAAARRRGASRSSPSATADDALDLDPPRRRARARRGRARALPGREDLDRPADRERLLLRLRVPRGRHDLRRRLRAHRGRRCASTSRPTSRSTREDVAGRRGARALPGRGPALQGRADRGPHRDRGRRDRHALHATAPFTDLCRGPHVPTTKRIKAFKLHVASPARTGAATPTASMLTRIYGTAFFSKEDLDAHLERLEQARARDHRKLGTRARPVHVLRASPGLAVLAARRHGDLERADRAVARGERAPRLPRGARRRSSTTPSCGRSRATGTSTATTCTSPRSRSGTDGPQADELPGAHASSSRTSGAPTATCRPLRRAGPRAPPRAERDAARPAARAPHHPGRRPHLLHRGAGRSTRSSACLDFGFDLYDAVRLRAARWSSRRGPRSASARRDVGPRRGGARRGARRAAACAYDGQRGRRRLLRPEDRPAHDATRWAARGSAAPSSSTTSMPERFDLTYTGADNAEHRAGDDPPRAARAPSSASSGS